MATTVTSILKYLDNNNQNFAMDTDITKSKKRRLDHLTWEEKIQRKKLKNRVAAQTSRDRKKAKMEQMEQAVQQVFSKNESLLAEVENLKLVNERLQKENAELYERLQAPCVSCAQAQNRVPPSTERKSHVPSSEFEQAPCYGPVENHTELPSLPDLLDELDADVDFNSLEQLTQSLLQDIARDLEATAQKTDNEESKGDENSFGEVVGQTPEKLESSRSDLTKKSLENDISEYLLLHHNYAAKPPVDLRKTKSSNNKRKLKAIRPKTKTSIEEPMESDNVIYGRLDDVTNVVTIIVDSEELPTTQDIVETSTDSIESLSSNNYLTIPSSPLVECLSPISSSESDKGYESLDSPHSITEDLWDQSISELFPSLF